MACCRDPARSIAESWYSLQHEGEARIYKTGVFKIDRFSHLFCNMLLGSFDFFCRSPFWPKNGPNLTCHYLFKHACVSKGKSGVVAKKSVESERLPG